jgi:iron complex transport system ATP-binding protein
MNLNVMTMETPVGLQTLTVHQHCRDVGYARNGRALLDGITVHIPAARLTAIIGPNGAGKTTLLRLLGGLDRPSQGEIFLREQPMRTLPPQARARRIGWLAQLAANELPLSVTQYVMLGRHAIVGRFNKPGDEDRRRVAQSLRDFDLQNQAHQLWNTLSGGERQRAGLARLAVQDVPLWLLDEPTNHLDLKHQIQLFQRLHDEVAGGRTVVAVLHDLSQAARWADHIVLLSEGRLLQQGPPSLVLRPSLLSAAYGVPISLLQEHGMCWHPHAATADTFTT